MIGALAEMEDWPKAWAFDGCKNIYTAKQFPGLPKTETVYEVMSCHVHDTSENEASGDTCVICMSWVRITGVEAFTRRKTMEEAALCIRVGDWKA